MTPCVLIFAEKAELGQAVLGYNHRDLVRLTEPVQLCLQLGLAARLCKGKND